MERILPHFTNDSCRGVVAFESAHAQPPGTGERFLTIQGCRAYLIGDTACGTCQFLFEKLGGASRAFEEEATGVSAALRDVHELPPLDLLSSIGRLLPTGDYAVALLTARPHLVMPATDLDYFWNECIVLFGVDPYYGVPHSPKTPYYRLCTLAMPPDGLLIELGIPLHQPGTLDRQTVERYKIELQEGRAPAVLTVDVLDIRQPATWEGNPAITKHYVLAQYLLDGHHKLQAAAELGVAIQILSFVSREESIYGYGKPSDLDRVLAVLSQGGCS
jgi:hypothetical protein